MFSSDCFFLFALNNVHLHCREVMSVAGMLWLFILTCAVVKAQHTKELEQTLSNNGNANRSTHPLSRARECAHDRRRSDDKSKGIFFSLCATAAAAPTCRHHFFNINCVGLRTPGKKIHLRTHAFSGAKLTPRTHPQGRLFFLYTYLLAKSKIIPRSLLSACLLCGERTKKKEWKSGREKQTQPTPLFSSALENCMCMCVCWYTQSPQTNASCTHVLWVMAHAAPKCGDNIFSYNSELCMLKWKLPCRIRRETSRACGI